MRVLVICDDRWHPADTVRNGLKPLEELGVEFEFQEDGKVWTEERMKDYPVIILSKSNNISSTDTDPWVTSEVEDLFNSYVAQGGGLLVIHSGTTGYKDVKGFRSLIGGVFTHHPEQCVVTVEAVKHHPITSCYTAFTVEDEHYFMQVDDLNADIILKTTSKYGTQPGGWARTQGKGHVCVLTPGHNLEVWLQRGFQKLILNSLYWCAGNNKYPLF